MTKGEILDRLESIASLENDFYSKDYIIDDIKELLNEARMKQIKFKDVPIEKRHSLCFDCDYCEQKYGSKVKTCRRKKQPKIITDGEDYKCYDREENDD
jgi:hypothetical protein